MRIRALPLNKGVSNSNGTPIGHDSLGFIPCTNTSLPASIKIGLCAQEPTVEGRASCEPGEIKGGLSIALSGGAFNDANSFLLSIFISCCISCFDCSVVWFTCKSANEEL